MTQARWLLWLRLSAVIALAASAALYTDYSSPVATFCGSGSGCAAVRASGWSYVRLGSTYLPVPLFGIIGYASVLTASLLPSARRLMIGLALAGGLIAPALLLVQALVIGRFCSLCVITDLAATAAGVAALLLFRGSLTVPRPTDLGLRPWAWGALALLSVAAPILWAKVRPVPGVPSAILALYRPGLINVVEFADFECPFCRLLHGELSELIESYPGKVHFVRLNMPLASHPHARDAARAAVCADQQGHGEAMADELFAAENLTPNANRKAAESLGLDLAEYDRCSSSNEPDARIERESQILRDAGFQGLPTTYVGTERIVGAQPAETFRAAFDRALRGEAPLRLPTPAFVTGLLLALASLIAVGRARAVRTAPDKP